MVADRLGWLRLGLMVALGLMGVPGVSPGFQVQVEVQIGGGVPAAPAPVLAAPPPPAVQPAAGPEVLVRGPIHEAFASPVVFNPTPGAVVPNPPPQTVIEEQPPDQRPPGYNVEWIPGYWAWDDQRGDYIWISGIWRDIPPGRQWVPGYWVQANGGFQWTSGFWAPTAAAGPMTYLPPPPQSLEVGPNSPQPGPDFFWSPGSWAWFENRYVWRPGYWVQAQPNWTWVPPSYVATPSGYVFNDGYWDYPLATRGLPFAPVAFGPAYYAQPAYAYSPVVTLAVGGLVANLFIQPTYGHYYFGDYYAVGPRAGYVPWFAFQERRIGYDPIYASYAFANRGRPEWVRTIREQYEYRVANPAARPPATFAAHQALVESRRARGEDVRGFEMARPINQIAANRLVAVERGHRAELANRQSAIREVQQSRARAESEARVPANLRAEEHQPVRMEAFRSPVAAAHPSEPRHQDRALAAPPPHPEGHQAFRPTLAPEHREPRPGQPGRDPRRAVGAYAPHAEPRPRSEPEERRPRR